MNYYEQLEVAPTANTEEIRRAHRRLAKIYHPDGHAEQEAKQLAEAQMQRINAIVGILSDPQRRRRYDKQLQEGTAPVDPTAARMLPEERSRFYVWRWWILSVTAAFVLTVAAIWLWMNDWGSAFKNQHPTYIAPEKADVEKAAPPQDPAMASTTVTVAPQEQEEKNKPRSRQNSNKDQQ